MKKIELDFIHIFAAIWSVFAMSYVWAITFGAVPVSGTRFADTALGFILGTIIATIIGYFYGSSKSSKDKDAVIQAMTKGQDE